MKQMKLIALDIGQVCVKLNWQAFEHLLGYTSSTIIPEKFMRTEHDFEKGRISPEEWISFLYQSFGHKFTEKQIYDAWLSIIGDTVDGMDSAIRSLAETGEYRFIYFSNTSILHAREVDRKNTFGHLVSGNVYSFEVGSMKPAPEIFEYFEKKYGHPYAYFDDLPQNVAAGKKRGWNAFVFTSAEQMLADLNSIKQ